MKTQHFDNTLPKRILSLDGGGIRGIITLGFLAKIESDLKKRLGETDKFRLSDFFDYIGGTSTGAIIATGLSLGMSVGQLMDFYVNDGKNMFDKNFLLKKWKSFYDSGALLEMLRKTFGTYQDADGVLQDVDMDYDKEHFKSLLMVCTMNRSTDSPWPISNNPRAKYNNPIRPDCNRKIKLFQLVRASAAAPVYFPPETLQWDPNNPDKRFVFVDGGVTPYNNPAFLLYRMATQPAYNLEWPIGEDKLLIVSVGTGSAPTTGGYGNLLDAVKGLPTNLMRAMQVDQDINCRTVGRCTFGAPVDRELSHMIPMDHEGNLLPLSQDTKRHFLYVRYDADISDEGLQEIGLTDVISENVREMDSVKYIPDLLKVGKTFADRQVNLAHFGKFVQDEQ